MPRWIKWLLGLAGGVIGLILLLVLAVVGMIGVLIWGQPWSDHNAGPTPITPPWALECWVWEDDVNTAEFVTEFLAGFRQMDFPARTILIDSPWSTRYNDFIVDEARYPNPEQFFTGLQDEGYRVVLWMTCMVNSESDDTAITQSEDWYRAAVEKGYLMGGGEQVPWWKGRGGFIDYTNPEAMRWWRGLQQNVFDWGLDGWKLDGTGTLLRGQFGPVPLPMQRARDGLMSMRRYMNHYYRDEYQHGLTQNPEFITLARSIDNGELNNAHPRGFAPLDAAPVTWVGDNEHTWDDEGIEEALQDILQAASVGYSVIGSDIGGYHGGKTIPEELYIRWAQFSAFNGLFLNGGHGERRLWLRSPDEQELIREYAWLHTELIPYMYSYIVAAHGGAPPLMRPLDDGAYHYMFGDWLLVAPIYRPGGQATVTLPAGKWRYWFNDGAVIEGPATFTREFPLDQLPVYIREGAIIPMHIAREYTGIGARDWEGFDSYLVYPAAEASSFTVHHPDLSGTTEVKVVGGATTTVALLGAPRRHILRVKTAPVSEVTREGAALPADTTWTYDAERGVLILRAETAAAGVYEIR